MILQALAIALGLLVCIWFGVAAEWFCCEEEYMP